VLSAIPRSAILFEPLYTERVPEAGAAGFPVDDIPEPGEGTASQKQFMERVLRGQVLNWWTCSCNPVGRSIRPEVWIVKDIRANYLLGWIMGTFPIRRAVFMVRHPCATVASRMSQGWAPNQRDAKVKQFAALRKFPHLAALCRDLSDPFEVMAARWCLMNRVPLSLWPRPFHVITYESLATRGALDLAPIFADWGLAMPATIQDTISRASATTKRGVAQGLQHRQPVDQWTRKLTKDQVAKILGVVRTFGMDFYSEDPEPDYGQLSGWLARPPEERGQ
jgi:hypothetical protein